MTEPNPQATSQAAILMPALVEEAFDYLVPEGTREGALVEATLASRALVGVVWKEGVAGPQSPVASKEGHTRAIPLPLQGGGWVGVDAQDSPHACAIHHRQGFDGQGAHPAPPQGGSNAEPAPNVKKPFTLKVVTRVIDDIPPLKPEFRAWIDWVSNFTLAPKGAVLSLCGLAHAAKTTRKKFAAPEFTVTLPTLTAGQQTVVDALKEKGSKKPTLLDGVTGSGKTEVYFHLIADAMNISASRVDGGLTPKPLASHAARPSGYAGYEHASVLALRSASEPAGQGSVSMASEGDKVPFNQILVLLPEIALTHQWLERFEKTFGAAPVVWHSRMTPAAKARAWQAVARGEAPIVVGARSALFLPFRNLKRIIVDEEHDPSYKQEEGVLYHARDMAVARAHFEQTPILLVSATPSLETMENVRDGKYDVAKLPERFGAAGLPSVTLVDMRINTPERGSFIAPSVKTAMLETLARGEQVLFFMNRRGYAPLLLCRTCGHRFQCGNCSAWLVVHGGRAPSGDVGVRSASEPLAAGASEAKGTRSPSKSHLACHHCGHKEAMPKACPSCNAEADKLAPCGPGVERIAQEIKEMFVGDEEVRVDIPPPLGGRLGGGLDETQPLPISAPPQPSPYGGGSLVAAKTLPLPSTLNFARELRKNLTEAEKKLWRLLRHEQMGKRFRKQHPIGNYVADFACLEPKLIIELDGGQHNDLEAMAYDAARTAFFETQGFRVLRFWNHEVLNNREGVFQKIHTSMNSLTHPHPNPPPLGEGTPRIVTLSSDEAIAADTWASIEAGEVDILVGTQMVAKGHHFPRLTLVVVVDADVGLDGADLRAGERSYQLLHQLGGRAGRGDLAGTVLVQTYCPEHPVMKALVAHDRNRLMALEAKERKLGGWPPFGQLAAILLDGVDEAKVRAAGQMLARTAPDDARITVLGPAPAPLSKLRGQYRYRILIKAKKTIGLQATLRAWLKDKKFSGVRIKVDVNPYYFL